jgi:Ca2+:H+ antiporter
METPAIDPSPAVTAPDELPLAPRWAGVRDEWFLGVSAATALVFALFHDRLFENMANHWVLGAIFVWLFGVILGSALAVVRHADQLATRLGEPYGTLILTLSVTFIEAVSISAVMLHTTNSPTLVRDTLFAIIMIILNGMVGVSLLLGGWKHREQHYNLQGANSYLVVILPLAIFSLLLPDYTRTTAGPTLSPAQQITLGIVSAGLYATFLAMQTGRQRADFALTAENAIPGEEETKDPSIVRHALLLIAYLIPIVFLAEALAQPVDYAITTLGAPPALGGVIIALLVATPEAISAVRAALANHMQRSVNIFLGSLLSTIGLTIPVMLIIGQLTGRTLILGLQNTDGVMLLLTLAVSTVTFGSGKTNVLHGLVHVVLFVAYLLLIVQG